MSALACAAMLLLDPIPQDPLYHLFSDQRTLFGIPHFWNVVSNIPFILVGGYGFWYLVKHESPGRIEEFKFAYCLFFIGILLTGLGSCWYHLRPGNESLVWDRVPMAIMFMSFFSIIIAEHISVNGARKLLLPLVVIGIVSVFYWQQTERAGQGDLRLYAVVQFLPALLIPVILLMFPSRFNTNWHLWTILILFTLSKPLEYFDKETYALLTVISGHSLKHIVSALAVWFFIIAVKKRRLRV